MSEPTLALALGGGGARGLAHIHVLMALDDLGIRPTAMSGTSIGALVGAGYAAGMSGQDVFDYVIDVFSRPTEVMARLWSMRPTSLREVWDGPRTLVGNIDSIRAVTAFMPDQVPATFEELAIPLNIVAVDFFGQSEVVLESGDLRQAVGASIALPVIFRPVRLDGAALVDGGILNALPYELLFSKADRVVAVDVTGGPKSDGTHEMTRVEAVAGASQLMMQAATRLKCRMTPPHLMIVPPVGGIAVLDFLKAKTILEKTAMVREQTKHDIDAMLKAG